MNKRKSSLRHAILTVSCVVAVAILAFNLFYLVPRQEKTLIESIKQSSENSLAQMSAILLSPLLKRELALVHETIDGQLKANTTWKRVRLVNADGIQIYPLENWSNDIEKDDLVIDAPINPLNPDDGDIRLVLDPSSSLAELRGLFIQLEIFQMSMIVLTLIVVFIFIEKSIVQPLETMNKAFRNIAAQQFDSLMPTSEYREIDNTIDEFKKSRKFIEEYQNKLENLRIQADEANKAKTIFMSRMSHELRTPLNSILGFSEIILQGTTLPAVDRERLQAIKESGDHLFELINDILDYAKIELTAAQIQLKPVNLVAVLKQCQSIVTPLGLNKGIGISFDTGCPDKFVVMADYRRLIQIIVNLISNGIKYNKPDGTVEIKYQLVQNHSVRISVQDDGHGLSEEEQEQIFKPFERLNRHSSLADGAGIGLTLCKELVELMQGHIGVDSRVNEGCSFWIELPIAPNLDAGKVESVNPEFPAGLLNKRNDRSTRVLVAEDNAVNGKVIQTQLKLLGFESILVADGQEALKILDSDHFDVLLTDIMMPVLDGHELTRKIRENETITGDHLTIIACSASASENDKASAISNGVDGFITKPISLASLRQVLIDNTQNKPLH